MKKKITLFLSLVLLLGIMPINTYAKEKPKLTTKSIRMSVDQTRQIKIKNFNVFDAKFSSSNKKIATVDEYGEVMAWYPGTCTIKVKCKKATLKCKVTVYQTDEQVLDEASSKLYKVYEMVYAFDRFGEEYDEFGIFINPERGKELLLKEIESMDSITPKIEKLPSKFWLEKETWERAVSEAKVQYAKIKPFNYDNYTWENRPSDTDLLYHYHEAFENYYSNL